MLYYVYTLARPIKVKRHIEWRVFYVGKGSKRRVFDHEREARSGCKCHKCNIIRKVWREGGEIQRYVVFTTENEQEAYEYEIATIALHGRENLCNKTDGGDAPPRSSTEASRERAKSMWLKPGYRERMSTLPHKPKTQDERDRQSEISKQVWANKSEEERAAWAKKIGDSLRGKPRPNPKLIGRIMSAETRRKISLVQIGRKASEETRRKMSVAHKGKGRKAGFIHSEETRRKMRESHARNDYKSRPIDPKKRERMSTRQTRRLYLLIAPDGAIHQTYNLRLFCEEHGLNYKNMHHILTAPDETRKRNSHHGWRKADQSSKD